jgi:hypothetical protein
MDPRLHRRFGPLFLCLAVTVLLAGSPPRAAAWDLPDELVQLLPAGGHVVVAVASLDEAERMYREFGEAAALAAGEEPTEANLGGIRELLAELAPDLAPYAVADRPLAVAMTLASPMAANPLEFTIALPVQEEALNPPLLRGLTGEMPHQVNGRYLGVTSAAAYPVDTGPAALATDLPDGVVVARADLASVVTLYRPMVELGLMALSQQSAMAQADSTAAAPQLTAEQIAGIQTMIRGVLDSVQRLDLAIGEAVGMPRLSGALGVAPGSVLDPGEQPSFERALQLSGYLPPHLPWVQASAVDASKVLETFAEPYRALLASSIENVPPEMAAAYEEWIAGALELQKLWMHPGATAVGAGTDGIRAYGVYELPDAEATLQRTIDFYLGISDVGIGVAIEEGPEQSLAGTRVRSFEFQMDPEQISALTDATDEAEDYEDAIEMAGLLNQLYPTIRVAVVGEHVLFTADPDAAAMGDLIQNVKAERPRVRSDVRAAAVRGCDGIQWLVAGEMRQFLGSIMDWVRVMDEDTPEVPAGDPVPVAMSGGRSGTDLTFAVETDLDALLQLVASLEELSEEGQEAEAANPEHPTAEDEH